MVTCPSCGQQVTPIATDPANPLCPVCGAPISGTSPVQPPATPAQTPLPAVPMTPPSSTPSVPVTPSPPATLPPLPFGPTAPPLTPIPATPAPLPFAPTPLPVTPATPVTTPPSLPVTPSSSPVVPASGGRGYNWIAVAIIGGIIGLFLLIIAVIVLLVGQSGTTTAAPPVGPSPTPRIGVLPPAGAATPTAIAPLAPSPAISGDHSIVVSGGATSPSGQMRYTTNLPSSICSGGCGTFAGTIALRQVRVTGANEFVVDVEITITDASGDPWLFNNGQGDIVFEVAGTKFTPTGNRNLPTQVTAKGTFSGYLTFAGRIPLIASGQYPVKLSIPSRLSQPLEGWLK